MGVNKENLYEEFLAVEDIKDNLERLFDHYIENRKMEALENCMQLIYLCVRVIHIIGSLCH